MPPEIVFLLKLISTSIRKTGLLSFKYLNFIFLPPPSLKAVQVVMLIGITHRQPESENQTDERLLNHTLFLHVFLLDFGEATRCVAVDS